MVELRNRTVNQGREFFDVMKDGVKIGISGHDINRSWSVWSFLPICGQYMNFKSKKALIDGL